MFQLRLGLMVALLLLAGGVVLVAGTTALTEQVLDPFDAISSHASSAVAGQIVRHGADAVDAAARAAVDEAARGALKKGAMAPEAEAALLARAGGAGAPAFALLVKPDGAVAARAGADVKLDANLAGLPVFAEAKTGVARDGMINLDGTSYHLAASPAYEGADLLGVVVLGWPYDAAFIDELARLANASAILLAGDKRLGGALPELTVEDLKKSQSFGAPDLGQIPGGVLPLLVPETGRYIATSLPMFAGDDSLRVAVVTDRNPAIKAIATAQALVIVGTLGLALMQLVLTLSVLRAVRKPIDVIMDHLAQFQQGGNIGILPEANLSGPFLRLGKQVNMILQMMPSAARPGAPLGTLTGSMPAVGASFPQGGNGLDAASAPELGSGPRPASPPSTLGEFRMPAVTPNPAPNLPPPQRPPPSTGSAPPVTQSGLAGLFDDGPDPLAAFRVQAPSAPPAPSLPSPPVAPPPMPSHDMGSELGAPAPNVQPEATVMFQVPQELIKQSAEAATLQAQQPTFSAPAANKPVDDARTVVAQVPQELLSQVAPKGDVNAADEVHYREVYDKFVETRIQCGEDTSDLTYDRFVQKLLKNRQQIVEKHKAKSVRFQVYVKEGKAALRALPVREP